MSITSALPTTQTTLPAALSRAIPMDARHVQKRDGTKVRFDPEKIRRAVSLAFFEAQNGTKTNPDRENQIMRYGLDEETFEVASRVTNQVSHALELFYQQGKHPDIESIQDTVEKMLAGAGHWEVAKSYMLYRRAHNARRLASYPTSGLTDYIAMSKYARWSRSLNRREVWPEASARVEAMHKVAFANQLGVRIPCGDDLLAKVRDLVGDEFPQFDTILGGKTIEDLISEAFFHVALKDVLPSMRSMQFGGDAILKNNARLFNCAFSPVDRVEFFREYFFLLLAGTGCGFSVQRHHVELLPALPARGEEMDLRVEHYAIADTIEGWADALHFLVRSHLEHFKAEFNYSAIRARGAELKTAGGKAPGHLPLKRALSDVDAILTAASGRKLRPIEVYDICMFTARAVLSGGIRRSATICLFSPDDEEMMAAKTGNWMEKAPQRSASNNSAVIPRSEDMRAAFNKLFGCQKEFGEPGFYFSDDKDGGPNPCVEISLLPVLTAITEDDAAKLFGYGYQGDLPGTTRLSGWQMCNLSTINGARAKTKEDFFRCAIYAAIIGTLQASYTKIEYLGPVTRVINEKDALLGVSICGIMDNPQLMLDPRVLSTGAKLVRATNIIVAEAIGINPAARTTCVKPEGTASLLLEAGSGIHPHHARHYFRRVQCNRKDPIYEFFKAQNPQMCEASVYKPDVDDVIMFPVEAPPGAMVRGDITALEFLNCVKLVQTHWVVPGTNPNNRAPHLKHNVSNTVNVKADEWEATAEFIWQHRDSFTGISLLADDGDKRYPQAPREEVKTDADVIRWNSLNPRPVDYTKMRETSDETKLKEIVACAGGSCELN